jgi:uncharacterized membrane protein
MYPVLPYNFRFHLVQFFVLLCQAFYNVMIIKYPALPVLQFSGVNMLAMYLPDDGFMSRNM